MTPPVNFVVVCTADGVEEGVAVALGVGVSETVGVGPGDFMLLGVLEHADKPPTTSNTITAKFIPRFTSKPFRSKPELSTIPTR